MAAPARTATRTMDTIDLPARAGSNVSGEESSTSSEDRVRKFQKTADHGSRLRKASASNAMTAARPPPANTTTPALRGRNKVPLGPRERPHDFSKPRVVSGTSVPSTDNRSFLPTLANEPTTRPGPANPSNPRFSFSKQPQLEPAHAPNENTEPYEFLPAVNFDDFANSLSYEPDLSDFPAPGTGIGDGDTSFNSSVPVSNSTPNMQAFTGPPTTESRPTRSNSFMRRFNQPTSRQPSGASTASSSTFTSDALSMPPPASNMAIRTRRQSQFSAQAPPNPAARAPRKSVGPGMLPTNNFDGTSRLAGDTMQSRIGRTPSLNRGSRRETLSSTLSSSTSMGVPKLPNTARTAKAKSLQPPSKQQGALLPTSDSTPDPTAMPITQSRSPGRSPAHQRTQTPSSSASKRQSTAPHISGLGARTISPTDARRLKRLSMNPNVPNLPGGPVRPPTPQGDFSFDERAFSQSPAIPFGNSVTPSSARATPEQNRKSYASGISLSSNSSFNSLKLGGSSIPLRINSAVSSSRLPTPKPRNVHSSAGGEEEEEVPPVPAIPKAYESPKEPDRGSFNFSTASVKSNLPAPTPSAPPATMTPSESECMSTKEQKPQDLQNSTGSIRHRRGLTVGAGAEPDRTPTAQSSSKKSLQPIRLPPLNLLPLGTPFNNRISSFPVPSAEIDERNVTPPPKRAVNKTPSTPMTASKASFFSKSAHHESYDFEKHLRSSSSAYNIRALESFDGPPAIGTMPIPTLNPTRHTTTPFASNSLPKNSGEFTRLQSRPSVDYQTSAKDVELQSMTAVSRPLQKKDTSDSAHTSESTEPETPSSGSSLRRKLSLSGWRRASSKAASHPTQQQQARKPLQKAEESAPQPPRHGDMAPPRLPASATWSSGLRTSPTPVASRARPSLDFGRRKTSTATIASDTEVEKSGVRKPTITAGMRTLSNYQDQAVPHSAPKSSSSILTPMQRMLGSKSSSSMLKARNLDSNLDRDDLVADEEMRKLASKRKDFENAARDVDDLRKRAKPQERVTPAQALQMVNLNIFERGEIIDYKEIYFCGTKSAKKHVGDLNAQTANFGYDDDRGDYNIVFGDHLAYRYEVVDMLGKGSFGQVVRCVDHKTGGLVAIKIIRNKKRFHQQALVEVNILQKLREWDPDNKHSMINFTQSFYFRGHLCISTELLGMNLYEFIKAHEFKGFSLRLIRRFCKQMLASLVLLKTQRVIHCDLKPENILLAHPLHSEIKVIDFGSSCFENEKVYTYIQSRFYRSPEVILGMSYGLPIDMWSLGCILAELLTGYPIFPGENEQEQLACIMEIFGPPEKHLIEKSSRKKLFFDSLGKPRVTVSTKGRRRRPSSKTLTQALKCDDEAFLDFISRCLRWDPERRMKPDEAMHHQFITGIRNNARQRQPLTGPVSASSPIKRLAPSQTPQSRVRPLPEPPATSFKNGTAISANRDTSSSSSPVKGAAPHRRHSTVQGGAAGAAGVGVKRAANGAPLNGASSLPRVAQRSVSGKPDLASAAAIASLSNARR